MAWTRAARVRLFFVEKSPSFLSQRALLLQTTGCGASAKYPKSSNALSSKEAHSKSAYFGIKQTPNNGTTGLKINDGGSISGSCPYAGPEVEGHCSVTRGDRARVWCLMLGRAYPALKLDDYGDIQVAI